MDKVFWEGGGFIFYICFEDGVIEIKNKYIKLFVLWKWVIQGSVYDDQIEEDFWNVV